METMMWHAGRLDRIPLGEGRATMIGGRRIAVFRSRGGEIFAVQAECPHLGGPLADGITGAGRVTCPLHGHVFDLASGQPVGNACHSLRTYPVEVSETGEITIAMSEIEQTALVSS